MRLVALLLSVAVLGYVAYVMVQGGSHPTEASAPKQTMDRARQAAQRIEQDAQNRADDAIHRAQEAQ
jgi:hypothetical protein